MKHILSCRSGQSWVCMWEEQVAVRPGASEEQEEGLPAAGMAEDLDRATTGKAALTQADSTL